MTHAICPSKTPLTSVVAALAFLAWTPVVPGAERSAVPSGKFTFAPPGGWQQPLPHFDPAGFTRYTAHTARAVRRYVALHYAVSVPFVVDFIARFDTLAGNARTLYALGIVATTLVLGGLLEGRAIARRLEILRLLVIGGAIGALPLWFGGALPLSLRWAMFALMLLSAVWLMRNQPDDTPPL